MSNSEKSTAKPGGHSKLYATFGIVAIVAGFFITADLASYIRGKKDITQDQAYTLSSTTESLLKDLPVEVKLRFYVSSEEEGLPPQSRGYAERFWDLLQEYERLANGKLKIERLHPSPDTDEEDSAIADGVYPAINPFSRDNYYFTVALSALGQNAAFRVDQIPEQTLEFLLTKTILEISTLPETKPKVTVVSSLPLQQDSYIFAELGKRYKINYVDPSGEQLVTSEVGTNSAGNAKTEPAKVDPEVVVIVHPHDISPGMEYEIDQYLLRGGKVLAFVDPAHYFAPRGGPAPFPNAPPQPGITQKSDLPNLFDAWGIDYSKDRYIADDAYKTMIWLPDPTPVVLNLSSQAITQDDPILSQIKQNTISVLVGALGGKSPEDIKREVLLKSSSDSLLITDRSDPYVLPHGAQPEKTLRILDADANKALIVGFEGSVPRIIPTTGNLHQAGIVGQISRLDIPRKLLISTTDGEGDDLSGTVTITGSDTQGSIINEEVKIVAGEDLQVTNNIFASVGSVSYDFGTSASEKEDTLDIKGAGEAIQHPIAIRLTGKFSTAFPDGRPEANPLPEEPAGSPMPNIPGLNIPGFGAPGAQGDPGEGGQPSGTEEKSPAEATPDSPSIPETEGEVPSTEKPEAPVEEETPADAGDPEKEEALKTTETPKATDPTPPAEGTAEPEIPEVELPSIDPPKVDPQEKQIKKAKKDGAVVVVADVDILNNQFNASLTNIGFDMRTGEPVQGVVTNTQLGNFSLITSLFEQLSSDVRLLEIQSRSNTTRPLTRLQEMEKNASRDISAEVSKFVTQRDALVSDIEKLKTEVTSTAQGNELMVQTAESEISKKEAELAATLKTIREMQKAKKAEEKKLVAKIKVWNIAAVPLFVILVGLGIAVTRRFITAAR